MLAAIECAHASCGRCEQYARFASRGFFNFNGVNPPPRRPQPPPVPSGDKKRARAPLPAGTAGVWRKACIEGAPPPPARAAAAAAAPIPAAFVLTLHACPPSDAPDSGGWNNRTTVEDMDLSCAPYR